MFRFSFSSFLLSSYCRSVVLGAYDLSLCLEANDDYSHGAVVPLDEIIDEGWNDQW